MPDGNALPVPKENADLAMDAAQCIGCGACVATRMLRCFLHLQTGHRILPPRSNKKALVRNIG